MVVGAFFFWLIPISFVLAAEKPPLEQACLMMDELVDEMLGTQISQCSPSVSKRAGRYSFYFVAKKPVLGNPADRRVWLLAVVGVAGRALTEIESFPAIEGVNIDEILTCDAEFARQRRVLAMPASAVKRIRNDLRNGTISLDRAYDQIKAAMTDRPLN